MKKLSEKKKSAKTADSQTGQTIILFLTKLGFRNLSVAAKLNIANRVINHMTGNPNFASPVPSLASLTALKNTLLAAEAAMDGGKLKTEQRDAALEAFTKAMQTLRAYVENTCSGNVEKILSSGFEVRSPRTKPAVLAPPSGLKATHTAIVGQVKLRWKAVKGGKLYMVEYCTDIDTQNWQLIAHSTKASVVLSGLTPGQKIYFRVQTINAAGKSGRSDMAFCRPS